MAFGFDPTFLLPPNARLDRAWQDERSLVLQGGPLPQIRYTTLAGCYDVVASLTCVYTADAVVGQRQLHVFMLDAQGTTLLDVGVPGTITANGSLTVVMLSGLNVTPTLTATFAVVPWPLIPMLPGYRLGVGLSLGGDAGDSFTSNVALVTHIPSGPKQPDTVPPALVPTPLLV